MQKRAAIPSLLAILLVASLVAPLASADVTPHVDDKDLAPSATGGSPVDLDPVMEILMAEPSPGRSQPPQRAEEDREETEEARPGPEDSLQQAIHDAKGIKDDATDHIDQTLRDSTAFLSDNDDGSDPEPVDDTPPSTPMSTDAQTFGADDGSTALAAGIWTAAIIAGAAAAKQTPWLRALMAPIATLFSRFRGSELLENPRRAELHALICKTPGITVPDLAEAAGLSRNTVLHHLRMMEKEHIIVSQSMGRLVHWYENGGRYGREHKAAYAILQDERSRHIARYLTDHPGSTQRQVAEALGLAPSVITWHLKRLESAELVERRRSGRTMECFPQAGLASMDL